MVTVSFILFEKHEASKCRTRYMKMNIERLLTHKKAEVWNSRITKSNYEIELRKN